MNLTRDRASSVNKFIISSGGGLRESAKMVVQHSGLSSRARIVLKPEIPLAPVMMAESPLKDRSKLGKFL